MWKLRRRFRPGVSMVDLNYSNSSPLPASQCPSLPTCRTPPDLPYQGLWHLCLMKPGVALKTLPDHTHRGNH